LDNKKNQKIILSYFYISPIYPFCFIIKISLARKLNEFLKVIFQIFISKRMLMNLAYITTYDARRLSGEHEWSGLGYHIAESLKNQSISLKYFGPLYDSFVLKSLRKLKRSQHNFFQQKNYQKDADPLTLKNYASQIEKKLSIEKVDVVLSATINPISYLECEQPIVFWADGTFANIHNFYPQYSNLSESVVQDWHTMEKLALQKSRIAIYSSDWAAQSAINDYGADPCKVKVVPFGSNVDSSFNFKTIEDIISSRPQEKCKLLFLGVDWVRKGGEVAYKVAEMLNQSGLETELTIVGCQSPFDENLPDFVKLLGFISKSTNEGKKQIQKLLLESHFLILPTIADCTPVVFCEANSLGVPCLSTTVGGIPTIIRNDINGRLFDKDAQVSEYCSYIESVFKNYSNYKNLALSAFHEYESRLNWRVAGQEVKNLLMTIV
jgi:glycosyltransferase involved in cell wall biosynthesis